MEDHEEALSITDSQLMRVVKPELDSLEARLMSDTRAALVAALSTVPTSDEVTRMIDQRIDATRKELQERINSIDLHLRQAEARISEASTRMNTSSNKLDTASDKFEVFIEQAAGLFADIKSKVDAVIKDVDEVRTQSNSDRTELTQTIDRLDDLKSDVHGDATKPQMPSLFRAIALTNDSVNNLNARVARYDAFVNIVSRIWQNRFGKAVIMVMLSAFATDALYSATKIIGFVLSGGKAP